MGFGSSKPGGYRIDRRRRSAVVEDEQSNRRHKNVNKMDNTMENECEDLTVTIPCELANRVRKYGEKTSTDLSAIMIEALDAFLGSAQK